jgi:ubiquinone/menaquinone biosynthesis C-methylase UbiE
MSTSTAPAPANQPTVTVVLEALKSRQHAAWSSGDYAIVGTTLQIVGEQLCEALDVRSGQRVLDVAAGNGNVTLAAARRWCDVVSTDYVPELLERGRARAQAEGLSVEFKIADAEALPFADNAFDMVVSTFGVMFTTNPEKAAAELVRVCKRGGKIGLANWTPDGFIGQMFRCWASICRRLAPNAAAVGNADAPQ